VFGQMLGIIQRRRLWWSPHFDWFSPGWVSGVVATPFRCKVDKSTEPGLQMPMICASPDDLRASLPGMDAVVIYRQSAV